MVRSSAAWRIVTLSVRVGSSAGVGSTLSRYPQQRKPAEGLKQREMVSFNRVVLAGATLPRILSLGLPKRACRFVASRLLLIASGQKARRWTISTSVAGGSLQ